MVHAFLHRNHILFASRESCSSEKKKKKAAIVFKCHTQWKKAVEFNWNDFYFVHFVVLFHRFIGCGETFGWSETETVGIPFECSTFWQMFWNRMHFKETEMLLLVSISWQELWSKNSWAWSDLRQWSWMTSGSHLCSIVLQIRGGARGRGANRNILWPCCSCLCLSQSRLEEQRPSCYPRLNHQFRIWKWGRSDAAIAAFNFEFYCTCALLYP